MALYFKEANYIYYVILIILCNNSLFWLQGTNREFVFVQGAIKSCLLICSILYLFHTTNQSSLFQDSDFESVDNNPSSVLGQPHELSAAFKEHYTLWLEQEVHGVPIDWERLLLDSSTEINTDKDNKQERFVKYLQLRRYC